MHNQPYNRPFGLDTRWMYGHNLAVFENNPILVALLDAEHDAPPRNASIGSRSLLAGGIPNSRPTDAATQQYHLVSCRHPRRAHEE